MAAASPSMRRSTPEDDERRKAMESFGIKDKDMQDAVSRFMNSAQKKPASPSPINRSDRYKKSMPRNNDTVDPSGMITKGVKP